MFQSTASDQFNFVKIINKILHVYVCYGGHWLKTTNQDQWKYIITMVIQTWVTHVSNLVISSTIQSIYTKMNHITV